MARARETALAAMILAVLMALTCGCFTISRETVPVEQSGPILQGPVAGPTIPAAGPSPSVTVHVMATTTRATATPAECSAPFISCKGKCIHPSVDNENCGRCGLACLSGQICQNGVCVLSCTGGMVLCSGACHDIATDPANCGSCGTSCPGGQSCKGGVCTSSCPQGQTLCTASFAAVSACVDTAQDPSHCGSCTNACPSGWRCSGGNCVAPTYAVVTMVVKQTSTASIAYIRRPVCSSGLTLCGSSCVDLKSDNGNCGYCGKACAKNQNCTSGYCTDLLY